MEKIQAFIQAHYTSAITIGSVFLIVLVVLALNAVIKRMIAAYAVRTKNTGYTWRLPVLESLSEPLRAMSWIVGLTLSVEILTRDGRFSLLDEIFTPTRDIAAIAVFIWFLLRSVRRIEEAWKMHSLKKGQVLDTTAMDAIGKLLRAAIIITGILVGMQALGFSISGILAFGGIGGIAVGFAAQGLVSNLFGGLTIYASRPFTVGEWIIMPGTEVMGEVQQIGWRATRVMGFDRRPFYVPNALFNTAILINHSRMTARRIQESLHLRYRDMDKVEAIVEDTNKMLAEYPGIDHEFFIFRLDACGDFALKLFLYAFTTGTDYTDYMKIKEDILLQIAKIIRRHGAALAIPTSIVHTPDLARNANEPTTPEPFLDGFTQERPKTEGIK